MTNGEANYRAFVKGQGARASDYIAWESMSPHAQAAWEAGAEASIENSLKPPEAPARET
jgi:hypothetical protein